MRKVERCTEWGPLRPMLHGTGVCWTITDMGSNRNLVWKQLKLVVIIECLGGGGVATTLNDRFGVCWTIIIGARTNRASGTWGGYQGIS